MRFYGVALAASAIFLGACGGKEKAADTAATAAMTTDTAAAGGAAATGGAAAAPAAGSAAMAPITGKTVEVKMVGDEKGYRFEPADITVKAGDGIKFINVSGGPHNAAFDPATVPAAAKAQLSANMPNQMAELSGPLLVQPNEAYTISFANVPAGKYEFHCTPHLAMGMKGTITVQ
jgi:plastocyanin